MATNKTFLWLSQILYPNGRAFRMPEPKDAINAYQTEDGEDDYESEDGDTYVTEESKSDKGFLYRLHRALALSFKRTYDAAKNILDSIHPDNPNFTITDARAWYKRLGIFDSGTVPLADMISGILQKRSFPTTPLNRRSPAYMEAQLRAAGFDVHVYKNRFPDGSGGWMTKAPHDILGILVGRAVFGGFHFGDIDFGETWSMHGVSLCVSYLEDEKDETFAIPADNYRNVFYIAGATVDAFANVPASRKTEFRQLILNLKSSHGVAVLFINYT